MLRKLFSSFRIGACQVDTILYQDKVVQGEKLSGEVQITGGEVEQKITGINIFLVSYVMGVPQIWHWLSLLPDGYSLSPNEQFTIPFQRTVPGGFPTTTNVPIFKRR